MATTAFLPVSFRPFQVTVELAWGVWTPKVAAAATWRIGVIGSSSARLRRTDGDGS